MPGELARDAGLSAEQEVTVTRVVKNAIDRFRQELQNRFCRLKDLNSKFGFLHDISDLLRDRNEKELKALRSDCTQFGSFYDTDVDGEELYNEIIDCKMLLNIRGDTLPKTPLNLVSFIISYEDDTFPNLRIALQILLTIAVSIASCERSFSKLKLILSHLRVSMGARSSH